MSRNRRPFVTADGLPGGHLATIVTAIDRRGRVIRIVLTMQDTAALRSGHRRYNTENREALQQHGAFSFGTIH